LAAIQRSFFSLSSFVSWLPQVHAPKKTEATLVMVPTPSDLLVVANKMLGLRRRPRRREEAAALFPGEREDGGAKRQSNSRSQKTILGLHVVCEQLIHPRRR
jgi:hypothetical protein